MDKRPIEKTWANTQVFDFLSYCLLIFYVLVLFWFVHSHIFKWGAIMGICIILAKVCKSLAARLNNLATKLENKPLPAIRESNRQAITNRLLMMLRSRNPNLDVEMRRDRLKAEYMIVVVAFALCGVVAAVFFMFPSIAEFFAKYSLLICFLVALLGLGILLFETIKKKTGSKRLATRPSAEIRLFTRGDTKK